MRSATACVLAAIAFTPAFAADPRVMSPDEFLSLVEGRTAHFTVDGAYYGSERYYGKGRSTWQFPGQRCEDGRYRSLGSEICFNYGGESCWSVAENDDGKYVAASRDGFLVRIARIDDAPLRCEGEPLS